MAVQAVRHVAWVNGLRTELYTSGSLQTAKAQVVMIPGNPGSAQYYKGLLGSLTQQSQGSLYSVAVSHLGHAPSTKTGKVHSLEDQIQHQAGFLRDFVLPHQLPMIVVGHSIGAYIAAHALQLLEHELQASRSPVVKVVAVFPFLSVNFGCARQAFIRRLTRVPLAAALLAGVLHLLPLAVRCLLVSLYAGPFNKEAEQATAEIISFATVRNALHMGGHEFKDLAHGVAWQPLQHLGSRLLVTFAEKDMWFNEEQLSELESHCPQAQVHRMPGQRHDFVTSDTRTEDMTRCLVQWLGAAGLIDTK